MKDTWHLLRAIDLILSLNGTVLKEKSLEQAKAIASRGLSRYNAQPTQEVSKCQHICSKLNLTDLPSEKK